MFRTVHLSIISNFSLYTQQWYMSYRFADIFLASSEQICMTYTIAVCTVKNSCDGQRNCVKHVDFYSKNKLEKLVHSVGFVITKTRLHFPLQSVQIKQVTLSLSPTTPSRRGSV